MFGSNKKNSGYSGQGYGYGSNQDSSYNPGSGNPGGSSYGGYGLGYNFGTGHESGYSSYDNGYSNSQGGQYFEFDSQENYNFQNSSKANYTGSYPASGYSNSSSGVSYFGNSAQTQITPQNQASYSQEYYSSGNSSGHRYSQYNNQKPINKSIAQQSSDRYSQYGQGNPFANGSYPKQLENTYASRNPDPDRQLALRDSDSFLDSSFGQFSPKNYSVPRYSFASGQSASSTYPKPSSISYSQKSSQSQYQQNIPKPNPAFSLPSANTNRLLMNNNLNITGKVQHNIGSQDYPSTYYPDSTSDAFGYPTGRPIAGRSKNGMSTNGPRGTVSNSRSLAFAGHSANNQIYTGKKKTNRFMYAVAFVMLFISAGVFTFVFNSYQKAVKPDSAVAGVEETRSSNKSSVMIDMDKYTAWIKEKNNGKYSEPDKDLTGGGLSNAEKFLLGLDPKKDNFCSQEKTDVQNLVSLIDPATCKPIDLNNENEVKKFSQFINIPKIKEQMLSTIDEKKEEVGLENNSKDNSVLGVFEIASYNELDKITAESLKQESKSSDQKLTYLEMVDKIEKYIEKYRSYEPFDRDYKPPVHPAVYLDTSVKYNVPLRYVLAIARSESRFGTDRFDKDGNPNRIGANQNIYSIGLDDSGNNKKYTSWEDGVAGFGRWYTYFETKKVPDCSKWRIYNPNGDYCSKIETLAKEIQSYLDK